MRRLSEFRHCIPHALKWLAHIDNSISVYDCSTPYNNLTAAYNNITATRYKILPRMKKHKLRVCTTNRYIPLSYSATNKNYYEDECYDYYSCSIENYVRLEMANHIIPRKSLMLQAFKLLIRKVIKL